MVLIISSSVYAPSQSRNSPEETCGAKHINKCLLDIVHDQAGIWTSPFRLQPRDAEWLIPFAAATGLAFHYDVDALNQLAQSKSRASASENISRFGSPEATIGEGIAMYAIGTLTQNDKLAETGRLGAEAVADASIVTEGIKLATNRDRPDQGEKTGEFWPSGTHGYTPNGSFPSGHATAAWALARVVGEEYRGFFPRLLAYGFATAVSVSRVTGGDHFPSDALVGSGIGFLTGGYVYRHHASSRREIGVVIQPFTDARTRAVGVHADVPLSDIRHLF